MTLIKSLLLGSATGIVAIASAQAADLPTRKGAPAAEYVRICSITVGGTPIVGWTLPGSDTCIRLSGYITGQIEGGNLKTGYTTNYLNTTAGPGTQAIVGTAGRDSFGYTTRFNFTVDAVSNTAYGPLAAHGEFQFNHGEGFDNTGQGGSDGGLNRAYVTWAGITAGKANSFFSFTGGGAGWANFMSSDRWGYNQPDLLAYTASFGGGFSATISIEDGQGVSNFGNADGAIFDNLGTNTLLGMRSPDIVASLDVKQGWGAAHLAGVAHQVHLGDTVSGATIQKYGWGLNAGVSFNLPSFGAGDQFLIFGQLAQNSSWYSGIPDAMWTEGGDPNGNGQALSLGDAYYNGTSWQTPTDWSITAELDHHFNPEFTASLEGSYGQVNWSGSNVNSMVSNGNSWLGGIVLHYDPVKNLDFEFELLYQASHSDTPNGYVPGALPATTVTYHNNADGFASRFEVTRSW
jgi:hypothetical protein